MKKIRSPNDHLQIQLRKHRKELERRRTHDARLKLWKSTIDEWKYRAGIADRPSEYIPAPLDFSLIREPEKAIAHITEVSDRAEKARVIVSDLFDCENFSTDAVIALIGYANDPKTSKGGKILLRQPKDPVLRDKYHDSGIYGTTNIRFADGEVRPATGSIYRIRNNTVLGEVAKKLIKFSTTMIFGTPRKMKGVYSTMIECMNNTFNHATLDAAHKEEWWATVYCDMSRRTAFFNFLDNGVGILESINIKFRDNVYLKLGLLSNADLLRLVLEGKIGSRTGLSYRGNGLPEIYKRFHWGQISRLIIIANNVYADLERDEYKLLPKPFRGTFFHWEISYDKHFGALGDDNKYSDSV